MKKIKKLLIMIMPFMTLLGGYVFCSNILYEPYVKAAVTYEIFIQPFIYFFQGIVCSIFKCQKKINIIVLSISLISSLVIMIVYKFLGNIVMLIILLICYSMYLLGYKLVKIFRNKGESI